MRAIDLLNYFGEPMKALSEVGIKMDDHQYLNLWKEYSELMAKYNKKTYAVALLSSRHHISERTLLRVIKRFEREL